jgi:hypothetical protein
MNRTASLWIGAGLAAAVSASFAAADSPVPKRPPALQAVVDCRKIEDSSQRLACYDSAVETMTKAEATGDLVAVDRAQRREVRRQSFGFTLPSLEIFDRGEKPEEINKLDETLAAAWHNSEGRWMFKMQDGAVWRQIDDESLPNPPHPGDAVVIKRAMLGSFVLDVGGQRGLKVHRDD